MRRTSEEKTYDRQCHRQAQLSCLHTHAGIRLACNLSRRLQAHRLPGTFVHLGLISRMTLSGSQIGLRFPGRVGHLSLLFNALGLLYPPVHLYPSLGGLRLNRHSDATHALMRTASGQLSRLTGNKNLHQKREASSWGQQWDEPLRHSGQKLCRLPLRKWAVTCIGTIGE